MTIIRLPKQDNIHLDDIFRWMLVYHLEFAGSNYFLIHGHYESTIHDECVQQHHIFHYISPMDSFPIEDILYLNNSFGSVVLYFLPIN